MDPHLVELGLGGLFTLLWWLVRTKDQARQEELKSLRERLEKAVVELWAKHDEDAARLQSFEVRVARDHYERTELDRRFDKLEGTFSAGIDRLSEKIDRLIEGRGHGGER